MTSHSLGNNLETTGNRLYTNLKHKKVLLSWSDRRCPICQRFLAKIDKIYCRLCRKKAYYEKDQLERNVPVAYYGMETIRDLIDVPLPRYLRDNLRGCYC